MLRRVAILVLALPLGALARDAELVFAQDERTVTVTVEGTSHGSENTAEKAIGWAKLNARNRLSSYLSKRKIRADPEKYQVTGRVTKHRYSKFTKSHHYHAKARATVTVRCRSKANFLGGPWTPIDENEDEDDRGSPSSGSGDRRRDPTDPAGVLSDEARRVIHGAILGRFKKMSDFALHVLERAYPRALGVLSAAKLLRGKLEGELNGLSAARGSRGLGPSPRAPAAGRRGAGRRC